MSDRAAIYTRISNDDEGEEKGVQRQEEDCRRLAASMGAEVVRVYVENDVSASTRSKKPRPQYDAMIRAVKAGEVNVILAYSNSRLTRRPRELEDLIDLHAATGVHIKTVVSGNDDLSTADGRMVARIKANVDAAEAERTAERVKRAKRQKAEAGEWGGGPRPYGFAGKADAERGLRPGVDIIEKEAEIIRHATKAVLAGRSLHAITRELNEMGSRTSFGNEWSRHSIRDVLLRPRNAGLVHTGKVRSGDVKIVGKAEWDPIVSRDEFEALCSILLDPVRRKATSTESKWLGSSIYVCGKPGCGGAIRSFSVPRGGGPGKRGKPARRLPAYKCADADHVSIMAVKTDDFVRDVVAEHVRDPRVIAAVTQQDGDALRADRERYRVLDLRLQQTERDYDDDLIDARRYKAKTDGIKAEMLEIDGRLADAAHHTAASSIFKAVDPGAAFLAAPLDVQRAVLRATLRVEVMPHTGPRGAAWSSERLRITSAVVTD